MRDEGGREREREREKKIERGNLKMKFCTKQFLCDLFLPEEILLRNFIN